MLSLILGITAFGLYFVYDINSFTGKKRIFHSFFLIGSLLILAAAALDIYTCATMEAFSGPADILLLILAAAWFAALVYCLFFALPFTETYADPTTGNHVYDGGVYALCRHPGILCFFFMYLMLGLAGLPGPLLRNGMVFSLLNLCYAWFQDRVTFPKTFCDYRAYRTYVPFLIPTPASIRRAKKTLFSTTHREETL